jgi:uncharacterized membrane protein
MNIPNPFKLNDWEIKKFLIFVFSIQLSVWGLIFLDLIGIDIPIIRQLICFIYLTFIPGFIILRILKIHNLDSIENILLTLGLSLSTIMILGLIINLVLPLIGIKKPFSIEFLIISISLLVFFFSILAYLRDKEYYIRSTSNLYRLFSPKALILLLIPFISIFGTYLVNNFQNYNLQLILFIVIFIIIFLLGFFNFFPKSLYPLIIFSVSLSLLYHYSLISNFLTGWDIQIEYYLSHLVIENGIWDLTITNNVNAMLSITSLAPIYSILSDLSLIWVYKIIYPLLFAFVPVTLYKIFKKQTNEKIALFACIFFISLFTFYSEMLALARQEIAELFLVLILLIILNEKIQRNKQFILLILFSFALITSHYGLTYIFLFMLVVSFLFMKLSKIRIFIDIKVKIFNGLKIMKTPIKKDPLDMYSPLKLNYIVLFIIITFSWYIYVSQSSSLKTIVNISDRIISTFLTDFLNPNTTQGLSIIQNETHSLIGEFTKYIHLTSQFLIGIGIVSLLLRPKLLKIRQEFKYFSIIAFIIAMMGIVVPYFSSSLNTSRLYQITLLFLAPFCIIGILTVSSALLKFKNIQWNNDYYKKIMAIISIFLIIFLMFNSGWIRTITGDNPSSISLSNVDGPIFGTQEILGARFCKDYKDDKNIYADGYRHLIFESIGIDNNELRKSNMNNTPLILFLGEYNIKSNQIYIRMEEGAISFNQYFNIDLYTKYDLKINEIYTNQNSKIIVIQ